MKLEIEVTGCKDCPFLKWGKTYGNDGRDGEEVCFCEKRAFGNPQSSPMKLGYSSGEKVVPKVPPKKCPYILDFLAEALLEEFGWNISTKKRMLEIFDDFEIEVKEGKNE